MTESLVDKGKELLPARFRDWFKERGWTPRPHQLELLEKSAKGKSTLLIAPTGAGKTLAGFLPSLVDLTKKARPMRQRALHTLYISPLKALAVDIARNLERPVGEMDLPVTLETRTGDTSQHKRFRQRFEPPDLLLTTPEQVALLLAMNNADKFFATLDTVIVDELHALTPTKRGDLLSLDIARLRAHAPKLKAIGLSATVAQPEDLRAWLVPQGEGKSSLAEVVVVKGGAKPEIEILPASERMPWSGHSAIYALGDMYAAIKAHRLSLIFVNTRSQAERIFQELWRINADGLPIALHHGSLDAGQRRKVEAAMAAGSLRAVVCTSTLDLGIDWGEVDVVINVGAPKGASRLAQRIGRANHRLDEPSKAILVAANRFEVLECQAALDANKIGAQDTPRARPGALDVLAQHTLGRAVAGPFDALEFYEEVRSCLPYRDLSWETYEQIIDFVATGGYALRTYERYAKIRKGQDGLWRISHPGVAVQYRLNLGTILESELLKVRLVRNVAKAGTRGGKVLGNIEEGFIESLSEGDTFLFAGLVLRFEGIRENEAIATRAGDTTPKIPIYAGGKFPLSTYLAEGVRSYLADPRKWSVLPHEVTDWLNYQEQRSVLPQKDELLVETFPRGNRHYLVCYPFEGRLAHQALGMLLTRRLERARLRPLGFVATDYSMAVWAFGDLGEAFATGTPSLDSLFEEDMLGDDLEAWMNESYLMKRTFRGAAIISGLIEKRHRGAEKTGRQMTVSTDLVYDVLRRHEPDHILLKATWADAASTLLDLRRLGEMLSRVRGRIVHKRLDRISPLAVPVMLEIGKERVDGEAREEILRMEASELVNEAMGDE